MARLARWIDALCQDLAYAARGLRRDPRFSAMVVATLSLGIGASAALFSLADRTASNCAYPTTSVTSVTEPIVQLVRA